MLPAGDREIAHLRLLSLPDKEWKLENLGLCDEARSTITRTLEAVNGLVLVTGVTGSGKTTLMYSLASVQVQQRLAAFSIEDPVEYNLPNVQQIEVDEERGLSMPEGLRTILRMNPDLIMIGEIRDRDSAMVAARAALSGRLVLATIHARDAAGAVDALHYLGVPYYIIGGALRLILAQNLLRRLCDFCKEPREPHAEESAIFAKEGVRVPEGLFDAVGCERCNQYGYNGLLGTLETAPISPEIAREIADAIHQQQLRELLRNTGVRSILVAALERVREGITSMEEVFRVCGQPAADYGGRDP